MRCPVGRPLLCAAPGFRLPPHKPHAYPGRDELERQREDADDVPLGSHECLLPRPRSIAKPYAVSRTDGNPALLHRRSFGTGRGGSRKFNPCNAHKKTAGRFGESGLTLLFVLASVAPLSASSPREGPRPGARRVACERPRWCARPGQWGGYRSDGAGYRRA
jgi:hypothetical protein